MLGCLSGGYCYDGGDGCGQQSLDCSMSLSHTAHRASPVSLDPRVKDTTSSTPHSNTAHHIVTCRLVWTPSHNITRFYCYMSHSLQYMLSWLAGLSGFLVKNITRFYCPLSHSLKYMSWLAGLSRVLAKDIRHLYFSNYTSKLHTLPH